MIEIRESEFIEFVEYIKENYGINLIEKKTLIESRLQNILVENGFESFSDYYDYIINDSTGDAVINLVNKITTNYTFFLRENDHFNFLRNTVLPYWESILKEKDLRIWSAGCSSGEEPYTLAMIINDYFGKNKILWDGTILATDISKRALKIAAEGIYNNEQINNIPPMWRMNYFRSLDNENSVVVDSVKADVLFRVFNLINDVFPFKKKFHMIFCRNVMIYFDNKTKMKLINKFYEYTEPGGYLFIGHSETINNEDTKYKYVMPSVYRKE